MTDINPVTAAKLNQIRQAILIFNPTAGDTRSMRMLSPAVKHLTDNGYTCTTLTTTGRGVASEYAEKLGADTDMVICSGGDGTVSEVIRGLMRIDENRRPRLGYLPSGSTNDFACTLGIPKRIEDMVSLLTEGIATPTDVGEFNGRCFAYVAAFGAFTDIAYSTSQEAKNTWGFLAYLAKGMLTLKNIRPIKARFTINGEDIEDTFIFCSISNSTIIAGVIKLKPEWVDMSDGKFEVILIKYPSNPIELGKIVSSITVGDYNCEYIRMFHAAEVEVEFLGEEPVPWSLDGEYTEGERRVLVRDMHSAVSIMLPEKQSNTSNKRLFDIRG